MTIREELGRRGAVCDNGRIVKKGYKLEEAPPTLELSLKQYQTLPSEKAFAVVLDAAGWKALGYSHGAKSVMEAKSLALKICNEYARRDGVSEDCWIYAENNQLTKHFQWGAMYFLSAQEALRFGQEKINSRVTSVSPQATKGATSPSLKVVLPNRDRIRLDNQKNYEGLTPDFINYATSALDMINHGMIKALKRRGIFEAIHIEEVFETASPTLEEEDYLLGHISTNGSC
ncbi:MAG: hypothetical protein NPIRA04_20490 [Nitrospirales bacterium]|nr:MAG: hypothetical protein NPIRA04_20490 [Nitrospirales bacterium]